MRGVLRIAGHEALRYVRVFNRELLLVAALGGIALGVAWPHLADQGVHPDAGLYRVELVEPSPLRPILESNPAFEVTFGLHGDFYAGRADLLIFESRVSFIVGSDKSESAARELERTAQRWLNDAFEREPDAAAAFPVRVNLIFEARSLTTSASPPLENPPGEAVTTESLPTPTPTQAQLLTQSGEQQRDLKPAQVDPPFPMESLLLTFAYLVPLNLVTQFYAGSLYGERVRQRGFLLLSAPFTGPQILLGKSLPYVLAATMVAVVVTLFVGGTLVSLLGILPVFVFALGSALLLALVARSPRELTFLLVTTTVLLSTFLFLPAVFVELHPVSFLSPITVVVADLGGDTVPLGPFLYATLPLTVTGLVLGALAVALYKEEHLFAPKRIVAKLIAALHDLTRSPWSLLVAGALAVPFAIGLELFLLVFAVSLDLRTAFVAFLLGGAFVEEALKGLVVVARAQTTAHPARSPWIVGGLVGAGFFLGEKIALVFGLVGFDQLPMGDDALATFGIASSLPLVVAPLLLHATTATITAHAARRGRVQAWLGWFAASLLHAGYNTILLVVATQGGGT